jgi:hypothetical protein
MSCHRHVANGALQSRGQQSPVRKWTSGWRSRHRTLPNPPSADLCHLSRAQPFSSRLLRPPSWHRRPPPVESRVRSGQAPHLPQRFSTAIFCTPCRCPAVASRFCHGRQLAARAGSAHTAMPLTSHFENPSVARQARCRYECTQNVGKRHLHPLQIRPIRRGAAACKRPGAHGGTRGGNESTR